MDNFDLKKYLIENKVTTNSKMLNENQYESEVLLLLKKIASEKQLNDIDDEYLEWFKTTEDFKNMISTEKLNNKSPLSAAKSIISLWR